MPAILPICLAKALGQARLLDQENVGRVDPEKNQCPLEMRPGQEHQRLAEKRQDDSRDHRIAHVAVGAPHDELSGWIPGSESAPTATLNGSTARAMRWRSQSMVSGRIMDRVGRGCAAHRSDFPAGLVNPCASNQ